MELAETITHIILRFAVIALELCGVVVLLVRSVSCLWDWFRRKGHARLNLAKGIELALEFKLGAEVFRTILADSWSELLMLGVVIVLCALMTLLLNYEIKHEEEHLTKRDHEREIEKLEREKRLAEAALTAKAAQKAAKEEELSKSELNCA